MTKTHAKAEGQIMPLSVTADGPQINDVTISGIVVKVETPEAIGSGETLKLTFGLAHGHRARRVGQTSRRSHRHFFTIVVWGRDAAALAARIQVSETLLVHGRIHWREWTNHSGNRREAVEIHADAVNGLLSDPASG